MASILLHRRYVAAQHRYVPFTEVTADRRAILKLMAKIPRSSEKRGVFLANDPALDFLNTEWPTATGKEDFFGNDADVFLWLRQSGLASDGSRELRPQGALLRAARSLRAALRSVVESRKAGKAPDLAGLNEFLSAAQSHPQLVWTKMKALTVKVVYAADTPEQILAPVALAAAELLSKADFRRVRRCGEQTCVHWFLDTTRPGRRRWCSMATCGNRLKVKSYRQRLKKA
jgi:predicted RNA-binding Zn ribbon-like protein